MNKEDGFDTLQSVELLGDNGIVKWENTEDGLKIYPNKNIKGEHAWVYKLKAKTLN